MPSTTKNGYVFKGWYKDAEFNEEFDFESNLITSDTTLNSISSFYTSFFIIYAN